MTIFGSLIQMLQKPTLPKGQTADKYKNLCNKLPYCMQGSFCLEGIFKTRYKIFIIRGIVISFFFAV